MNDYIPMDQLYREAVQKFPFPDLKRSGGVEDELSNESGDGLYGERFSFIAGHLLNSAIHAKGYIEITREGNKQSVVAVFWLSIRTGWFTKTELKNLYLRGEYHILKKRWGLMVNTINK